MNLLKTYTRELGYVYRMGHTPPFFLKSTISAPDMLTTLEYQVARGILGQQSY